MKTASERLLWGWVSHLVADWPLQNDWMARNKASLRHPSAWVHAAIHGAVQVPWFGLDALPIAVAHLLIDTRKPVVWASKLVGQTQPSGARAVTWEDPRPLPVVDVGTEVRFWTDQVWHVAVLAVVARLRGDG